MEKEIFVPIPKFDAMAAVICCSNIVEGKNCELVRVFGKSYVISAAVGTGTGRGWSYLKGYEVTPEPLYRGHLVALDYERQISAILNDERPRSYNGLKIKVDGETFVCVGSSVRFYPKNEGEQTVLNF